MLLSRLICKVTKNMLGANFYGPSVKISSSCHIIHIGTHTNKFFTGITKSFTRISFLRQTKSFCGILELDNYNCCKLIVWCWQCLNYYTPYRWRSFRSLISSLLLSRGGEMSFPPLKSLFGFDDTSSSQLASINWPLIEWSRKYNLLNKIEICNHFFKEKSKILAK